MPKKYALKEDKVNKTSKTMLKTGLSLPKGYSLTKESKKEIASTNQLKLPNGYAPTKEPKKQIAARNELRLPDGYRPTKEDTNARPSLSINSLRLPDGYRAQKKDTASSVAAKEQLRLPDGYRAQKDDKTSQVAAKEQLRLPDGYRAQKEDKTSQVAIKEQLRLPDGYSPAKKEEKTVNIQRSPLRDFQLRAKDKDTSVGAPKGINLLTAPELTDENYAQNIENYLIDGGGILKKREGITEIFSAGKFTLNYDSSDQHITVGETVTGGTSLEEATVFASVDGYNDYDDISTGVYASKSFAFLSQDTTMNGFVLKSDGSKLYAIGNTGDSVYQYTLSTPWDLSTTSYDSVSFSVNSEESTPLALFIKSDGTKMYVVGSGTTVYQYTLGTAWDLSTASYDSKSFSVASEGSTPRGLFFNSDGDKMYVQSFTNDFVYQYSLSTEWDVSTASYDSVSLDLTSDIGTSTIGLFIDSTGTFLFVANNLNSYIHQFSMSTEWDLSTATYDSLYLDVSSEDSGARNVVFTTDMSKCFVNGGATNTAYQYGLTATAYTGELTLYGSIGNGPFINNEVLTSSGGATAKVNGTETLSTDPISMLEKFTDRFYILAIDDTVYSYDTITGDINAIKSYNTDDNFDGAKYFDYFYFCNGSDSVDYVTFPQSADLIDDAEWTLDNVVYVAGGNDLNRNDRDDVDLTDLSSQAIQTFPTGLSIGDKITVSYNLVVKNWDTFKLSGPIEDTDLADTEVESGAKSFEAFITSTDDFQIDFTVNGTNDYEISTSNTNSGFTNNLVYFEYNRTTNFAAGEIVTGAGGASGTIVNLLDDKMVLSGVTGAFVNGEAITGSISGTGTIDTIPITGVGEIQTAVDPSSIIDGTDTDCVKKDATERFQIQSIFKFSSGATRNAIIIRNAPSSFSGSFDVVQNIFSIDDFTITKQDKTSLTQGNLANAPYAKQIFVKDGRMYAGQIQGDTERLSSSEVWDGDFTNVPFSTWTTGTNPESGFEITGDGLGDIQDITELGSQIVVFYEDGKKGIRPTVVDSASGLALSVVTDFKQDGGAYRAVLTPYGIFYISDSGLWQMVSGGNTNQPYSANEQKASRILGESFIAGLDFSNGDIIHDFERNLILVTCKAVSANDTVLWYNIENQSFGKITGWGLNRFMRDGDTLYGGSSTNGKVFQLFDGNDDDGSNITSEFKQEVNLGIGGLFELTSTLIKGFIADTSNVDVDFDIYDKNGKLVSDKLTLDLASYTGNSVIDGMRETRAFTKKPINEFERIIVKVSSNDQAPHKITYFQLETVAKGTNTESQQLT